MIRLMKKEDMPAVLDIWLAGNTQAHPFIPVTYWQGQLEKMEQVYLPSAEVFVYEAEDTHEVVGFLGITEGSYIAGLFVHPAIQGQGVGRYLLVYGQETYPCLSLHVYCDNKRAVRFYERNGFTAVETSMDEATGAKEQMMVWKQA